MLTVIPGRGEDVDTGSTERTRDTGTLTAMANRACRSRQSHKEAGEKTVSVGQRDGEWKRGKRDRMKTHWGERERDNEKGAGGGGEIKRKTGNKIMGRERKRPTERRMKKGEQRKCGKAEPLRGRMCLMDLLCDMARLYLS